MSASRSDQWRVVSRGGVMVAAGGWLLVLASCPVAGPASAAEFVVEDFADVVTQNDAGHNQFSGNTGGINGSPAVSCQGGGPCVLHLSWDFRTVPPDQRFSGIFFALFGLTDVTDTLDGLHDTVISFPNHVLNLDDIDAPLREPRGPRALEDVCVRVTNPGPEVQVKLELKDAAGSVTFLRVPIATSMSPLDSCWSFRSGSPAPFDRTRAKIFSVLVESLDGTNPSAGKILLHRIWFRSLGSEAEPASDHDLLALLARRTYQYFLDWSSRDPRSRDIPQDRSTFGNLLHAGAIGFALPAHVIAAENGWIARSDAAARVLNVLRVLDDPAAFCASPVGCIGVRGWFYRFLGIDARRKLNRDPNNTVEVSTIDTGLALMGVLAARDYFTGVTPVETEIRQRAQSIYDRVDWTFMLDPASKQFHLAWKPAGDPDGTYTIPDPDGAGHYAPSRLDYYTDEALIVVLLAVGSTTHPVGPEVYCSLIRDRHDGLVRTYPGALFTYQFLHAFIDTATLGLPACPGETAVNWFENSRLAMQRVIAYAGQTPPRFATYGPNAWGISAAEGPADDYRAYGAPCVAVDGAPPEDGTVTNYAMLNAADFGDDLRQRAIGALRQAWARGDWHPRFGLPDAFNDEIGQAGLPTVPRPENPVLRWTGRWRQRALFGVDQGPMLLHLANAADTAAPRGLVHDLLGGDAALARARSSLGAQYPTTTLDLRVGGSADGVLSSSNVAGLSCSSVCAVGVPGGQPVTLVATALGASAFREWRGACSGSTPTCTVSIDRVRSVTAVFSLPFTDDPVRPGVTAVRARHFLELQQAIDRLRVRRDLAAVVWSAMRPGDIVRKEHLDELCRNLPQPMCPEVIRGQTVIRAAHINDLRRAVRDQE